jgi:hypothetical protein
MTRRSTLKLSLHYVDRECLWAVEGNASHLILHSPYPQLTHSVSEKLNTAFWLASRASQWKTLIGAILAANHSKLVQLAFSSAIVYLL